MDDVTKRLSASNILIITHLYGTGPSQELRDYLKDKVNNLLFIEHPFPYCNNTRSSMVLYRKGAEKKRACFLQMKGPDFLFYIKDFLLTFAYALMSKIKFDIVIAADNLNSLSAICLRKLGRVKKVIFFTIDYTPLRFKNRLLNSIYHWIDRFCCYNADVLWDNSPLFRVERERNGVDVSRYAPFCIVPIGSHFSRIERLSLEQIDRYAIAYMGHLLEQQGIDLVIESLPELTKFNPRIKFIVIGKGEYEPVLKERVKKLGLSRHVDFRGYVENHEDAEKILSRCGLAVAPYMPNPVSVSNFSDTGKPKVYMSCGLPVIMTKVPPLARKISEKGLGVTIDYERQQFIDAVKLLLSDEELYREYRNNAIKFASGYEWSTVFHRAFAESLNFLKGG